MTYSPEGLIIYPQVNCKICLKSAGVHEFFGWFCVVRFHLCKEWAAYMFVFGWWLCATGHVLLNILSMGSEYVLHYEVTTQN